MRESVIGIQPSGGCTPLAAPSQFSQYPWSTLPAGFDLTAQVSAAVPVLSAVFGGAAPTSIGTTSAAARPRPSSRDVRPMIRLSFLPGSAAAVRKVRPARPMS